MRKSKIIEEILKDAKNPQFVRNSTMASLEWNRKKIKTIFEDNSYRPRTTNAKKSGLSAGEIYLFQYSPKHKDTLPYYDRYPLCLIIGASAGGFLGLNFHYLRPTQRAQFMKALYKFEELSEDYDSQVLNVTYEDLISNMALRYYKPCLKRYLVRHIITNPLYLVNRDEWNMTLFLPTQKFIKESDSTVWRDSAKLIK